MCWKGVRNGCGSDKPVRATAARADLRDERSPACVGTTVWIRTNRSQLAGMSTEETAV
jgi:hypothetical protein